MTPSTYYKSFVRCVFLVTCTASDNQTKTTKTQNRKEKKQK